MKILIVEDDKVIASGLEYALLQEGYETDCADTLKMGLEKARLNCYGLYLIDLNLPDGTGYTLCQQVKKINNYPVIFLTAVDDEVNVVMGLDMGADDYITKPFRVRELMSRIKSVLRRYNPESDNHHGLKVKDITISFNDAKVYKNNMEVQLTAMEYKLLLIFVQNLNLVLTRSQLLEGIFDVSGEYVNDNTLTVYIKRLREKLEDDPNAPILVKTIRGLGYLMER